MKHSQRRRAAHVHHSFNVPRALEERVARCMALENLHNFTDFANRALSHLCREIERAHAIDSEGRPVK